VSLSEADVERIVVAVETMERSLSVLAEKRSLSRSEYRRDRETRDVVERRFVKLTEAALDIAETLAVHERGTRPESNPGAMVALEAAGVLDGPTAAKMAEAARFRNVLAHTYGDAVDHDDVYDALQDLERYRDFLLAVRDYMDEIDALD
jgi:uncharacterized protein YutE (UPF0331/DUF86 family)